MIQNNIDDEFLFNLYKENIISSTTDLNGTITSVSKAYEKISGYTKEELIGQNHNMVRHPDMPSYIFEELWNTIQSGNIWKGEIKNLKKDGTHYWVYATISPYKNNNGSIIGYASVREDITDKKDIIELNKKITDMLNYIKEGYLIVDKNMKVSKNYSNKCLEILNTDTLYNKDISELLFKNDKNLKEEFDTAFKYIKKANKKQQNLYISLLPTKHELNKYVITLNYTIMIDGNILILITDITNEEKLAQKVLHEQKMQKMIITIAKNKKEIIDIGKTFEGFLLKVETNKTINNKFMQYIKMELHRFKGLFAQLEMLYVTDAIDTEESHIKELEQTNNSEVEYYLIILCSNLRMAFNRDLKMISDILGKNFISSNQIEVNLDKLNSIENNLLTILQSDENSKNTIRECIKDIRKLKGKTIYNELYIFSKTIQILSKKLEKPMFPFELIGDKEALLDYRHKKIMSYLVHIFRNSMAHGIEPLEVREERSKSHQGKISCIFKIKNKNLLILISDDGNGLDFEKISKIAIEKNLIKIGDTINLSKLIFMEDFTTYNKATNIAGRGIGLSAIADEIRKLNGKIRVINRPKKGLSFFISLPYMPIEYKTESFTKHICDAIILNSQQYLTEDINLNLISTSNIEKLSFKDESVVLKFDGKIEFFCYISFSIELLNAIFEFTTKDIIDQLDNKDISDIRSNLLQESANTIIGLSIKDFPKELGQLTMGIPCKIDHRILENFCLKNEFSSFIIKTNRGDLNCTIIDI